VGYSSPFGLIELTKIDFALKEKLKQYERWTFGLVTLFENIFEIWSFILLSKMLGYAMNIRGDGYQCWWIYGRIEIQY